MDGVVSNYHEVMPKNGFCEKPFLFVSAFTVGVGMLVGCFVVFFVIVVDVDVINCTSKVCNIFLHSAKILQFLCGQSVCAMHKNHDKANNDVSKCIEVGLNPTIAHHCLEKTKCICDCFNEEVNFFIEAISENIGFTKPKFRV